MQITAGTLATIAGRPVNSNMQSTIAGLERAGVGAGLNRPHRLAQFLAQIAHESGLWRYDAEVWGPTAAQKRYDTRTDLGNTAAADGDGFLYRGRGPIQITGRANYREFTAWARALDPQAPDFVANPDAVLTDPWEGLGPIWYWDTRDLNRYADNGDLLTITKRINGGTNGLADRQAQYTRAGLVLLGFATVKQFQDHVGLKVDGISGPRTRAAIHAELLKRPIVAFGTQRPATTIAPGNIRPAPKPVPVLDTLPPQPARSGPPTMTLIALVVFVALLVVFILKG